MNKKHLTTINQHFAEEYPIAEKDGYLKYAFKGTDGLRVTLVIFPKWECRNFSRDDQEVPTKRFALGEHTGCWRS